MIYQGDCIEVMAGLPADSVDAVVTDPPYGLEFMGKEWDKLNASRLDALIERHPDPTGKSVSPFYRPGWGNSAQRASSLDSQKWHEAWGREALRVTKPGGYLLAFGGTRTHHRLVCGLEDAGWIIRDELTWVYASGFPKGKANLKPAHEPIVLARKPGPLRHLNIDENRIGTEERVNAPASSNGLYEQRGSFPNTGTATPVETSGRWPSNLLLQDPELFDTANPYVVGSGAVSESAQPYERNVDGESMFWKRPMGPEPVNGYGDTGGYSRFFIIPKADRADREPVLRGQLPEQEAYTHNSDGRDMTRPGNAMGGGERKRVEAGLPAMRPRLNAHPTVKPVDLMRHLVRLVTPTGGTVLDCFLGSGSTAIAAEMEGFDWIGIEKEPEYVKIAEARLNGIQKGLGLAI